MKMKVFVLEVMRLIPNGQDDILGAHIEGKFLILRIKPVGSETTVEYPIQILSEDFE